MDTEEIEIKHSKLGMVSFGSGKLINEFFVMCFGAYVFFFYEVEIGLESWLAALGYIIFAAWNAVNDPLIGYLTDRPFKFTKKWGRRFPWVLIGGIPFIFSYLLIFTPPAVDPQEGAWILFLWLVTMTCLYDTFLSLWGVNFYSIEPDKFRSQHERRVMSALSTLVAALGTALGGIIPPLFIVWGDLGSYVIQAVAAVIICLIAFGLSIPGSREDQIRIDCYLEKCEEGMERKSFFKEYVSCLKHKNFMIYIISFMCYQSLVAMMTGSIPYVAQFVIGVPASDVMLIMAGLLLGMFCAMPLWAKIADKTDNDRRAFILGALFLTIVTLPLFFIDNYFVMLIGVFVLGMGFGAYWVMMTPVRSTVIDESVIMTGQRKEGIYQGFQTFFAKAALVAQAVSFATVHTLTGFVEGSSTQTPEAIVGIQIHFSLIPMVFMLIATILLWKFFTLTPDRVKENKEKLIEMGL
jgi:GPH family glycoside/pentoside/hexuronide:cation symporter